MTKDRYKLIAEFIIAGEDECDAEDYLKMIVQEGILAVVGEDNDQLVEAFEIIDAEPAELP
jgi:hypothetical protein